MSKTSTPRKLAANQACASLRNLRISPQKLNLLADTIRGLSAEQALAQLTFSRKAIARDVKKLLQSAIANAENNHDLDVDRLHVTEVQVGKSITMKRIRPRARGRAFRIAKPFSRISITLTEKEDA